MKDFRELKVWRKAHVLTLSAYRMTAGFPRQELFGLSSQIRTLQCFHSCQYSRGLRSLRQR